MHVGDAAAAVLHAAGRLERPLRGPTSGCRRRPGLSQSRRKYALCPFVHENRNEMIVPNEYLSERNHVDVRLERRPGRPGTAGGAAARDAAAVLDQLPGRHLPGNVPVHPGRRLRRLPAPLRQNGRLRFQPHGRRHRLLRRRRRPQRTASARPPRTVFLSFFRSFFFLLLNRHLHFLFPLPSFAKPPFSVSSLLLSLQFTELNSTFFMLLLFLILLGLTTFAETN